MIEHLKRNIRLAAKSVFFHYKQYLCFFAAAFIVQFIFGAVTAAYDNYDGIKYKYILEEYDYHLLLKDLNTAQYTYLINGGGAVFTSDKVYEIIKTVERDEESSYNRRYDLYLRFTGENLEANYKRFTSRFGQELAAMSTDNTLHYTVSPAVTFASERAGGAAAYFLAVLLITPLALFLMTALYYIRINHYKFTYGVYMSFGADFKKLFETSFWELMTVTAVMLPFSAVFSALTDLFIFRTHGESFVYNPWALFKTALFSLLISAFSVIYPVWRLSKRTPISLITAEDNSNLVSSPRMSFEMYGISFPRRYELFSMWRFRRYYLKLFAAATVFAVTFVGCTIWNRYYIQSLKSEEPQYTLYFSSSGYDYTYTPDMTAELKAIEGVKRVEKSLSAAAGDLMSHIAVSSDNTTFFSGFVSYGTSVSENTASEELPEKDRLYVTNEAQYKPYDKEIMESLEKYEYDGGLSSALENGRTVVISDSIDNRRVLKLKPRDKIYVGVYKDKIMDIDWMLTGSALLRSQLNLFYFDYYEFTVGAVLKNDMTVGGASVYFSDADYKTVTGRAPAYRNAYVYADREAGADELRKTEYAIRKWADLYGNVSVINTHAVSRYKTQLGMGVETQTQVYAALILAVSPLIWFFSEVIFYLKRENEFYVVEMFGAQRPDIKKIYLYDGILGAAAASVMYVIMSFICLWALFSAQNDVVVKFFGGKELRYGSSLPPLQFVLGLLLTAACGFLSAYIPYLIYKKKRSSRSIGGEANADAQ